MAKTELHDNERHRVEVSSLYHENKKYKSQRIVLCARLLGFIKIGCVVVEECKRNAADMKV